MQTNNFFDPDRFANLVKQDIVFHYKFYLSFLVGLSIGAYVVSFLIIRYNTTTLSQTNYFFLYILMNYASMVFIGMSFPAFRNQIDTCNYLLIPGSAFEKLLVQFVIRFVLFLPVAMVILRVCIFLAIASMSPDPKTGFDPLFVEDFSFAKIFPQSDFLRNNPIPDLSYLFFVFAGSVYFKRYAVVKTLVALLILPVIIMLLVRLSVGPTDWFKTSLDYLNGSNFYLTKSPACLGLILLCLPWAYFKLTEKEL